MEDKLQEGQRTESWALKNEYVEHAELEVGWQTVVIPDTGNQMDQEGWSLAWDLLQSRFIRFSMFTLHLRALTLYGIRHTIHAD